MANITVVVSSTFASSWLWFECHAGGKYGHDDEDNNDD